MSTLYIVRMSVENSFMSTFCLSAFLSSRMMLL